jgi:hypothetical protein
MFSIGGPAPYPVPRVLLEYDQATGDIYVVGMGPPTICGHGLRGVTDPAELFKYDLQEGQIVTQITLSQFYPILRSHDAGSSSICLLEKGYISDAGKPRSDFGCYYSLGVAHCRLGRLSYSW